MFFLEGLGPDVATPEAEVVIACNTSSNLLSPTATAEVQLRLLLWVERVYVMKLRGAQNTTSGADVMVDSCKQALFPM